MSADKTILIASSVLTNTHIAQSLALWSARGFTVVVWLTDKVLDGSQQFELEIDTAGHLRMTYERHPIEPNAIAAAWYWKVAGFRVADAERNVSKQLSLVNEMSQWNAAIWSLYPDDIWLNSPAASLRADRKLEQLLLARQVGFEIPRTLVGNEWTLVEDAMASAPQGYVVKMLRGVLADQNIVKAMYTTLLDESTLEALKDHTVPFPGMYQPSIQKAREWRITVVGDRVFPAAIYTADDAKDDWRRLQLTPSVQFVAEQPPNEVSEKCLAYLSAAGLGYGAFDLVEEPGGRIVFLECNPNGQHNWLEELLELPIAEAITDELAKRAID